MLKEYDKALEAINYLKTKTKMTPNTVLALGTGLSEVSSEMDIDIEVNYRDIPHFVDSTVEGHNGTLLIGTWKGQAIAVLSGRQHYYEGYSMKQITLSTRVLGLLGAEHFIYTNVAGGLHPDYQAGDLVFVKDHIYMMPENPLRGDNDIRFGPRFPDMSQPYNLDFIDKGLDYSAKQNLRAHQGVYYCLQGPNLETPAEYQYIHRVGGDLVGMSTIPEVLVAKHMGKQVNVISIVSNVCYPPDRISKTTIQDVIDTAQKATPGLLRVIRHLI